MEDHKENRPGLHKEVSSIFDGVPIPSNDAPPRSSDAPAEPPSDPRIKPSQSAHAPAAGQRYKAVDRINESYESPPAVATLNQTRPAEPIKAAGRGRLQQIRDTLFAHKAGVSNPRQKTMMLLIPVLTIALIFVLSRVLGTPSRTRADTEQPKSAVNASSFDGQIQWQIPTVYTPMTRDPMELPATLEPPVGDDDPNQIQNNNPDTKNPDQETLVVRGILHSQDRPSAVIGTKIVYEGDIVFGATVVRISRDSVEFERVGESWIQIVQP